jgi:hypothetical protein
MGNFETNFLRLRYRLIIFISLVVLCINCIDPYNFEIIFSKTYLVVDALITDEDAANYVKLSWSFHEEGEYMMVGGAVVVITDDTGNSVTLAEGENGEYWTDPSTFRGEVGRSYTLNIFTPNGDEYESSPCLMYPATVIDSLYYTYYEAVPDGYLDLYKGVNIYLDTPTESGSPGYRRWTYDEWWKFEIPYTFRAKCMGYWSASQILENKIGWSNNPSMEIDQYADIPSGNPTLNHSVLFLPTELSNRFQFLYYIEVKQFSISMEEYMFWNSLDILNEASGDIFDSQPFSVTGNVKNLSDNSKNALGYFRVSAVSSKHLYITEDDIENLDLPKFSYECDLFIGNPKNFHTDPPDFWEDL